ncbi:hypothetical protein DE146DRAFT_661877 [Phaeosphaeria sp. MPI-PUGE-AT-0046c]|nr:hypothetical protein DE146DRAFT_661877 [Phaeosphaeria sp. MPI-PUGE-AT-0046c]
MQCMTAPTRGEVDRAHAARRWLDIGVPSFRNLRRIGRDRLVLWLLLGLSSLPLHLLYNSVVYVSLSTNSYDMFVVSQAFVDDPDCQNCTDTISNEPAVIELAARLKGLWEQSRKSELDRLSPMDCLSAYGTIIQTTRRNLLVVTANENIVPAPAHLSFPFDRDINNTNWYQYDYFNATTALGHYQRNSDTLQWICSELPRTNTPCINRIGELKQAAQSWVVGASCSGGPPGYCDQYRWPVDYCLSERADLQCKLHFNSVIAAVVAALNFFKAILMFYIAYSKKSSPLATIGDAIASFLDEKDSTTASMGPTNVYDVKNGFQMGAVTWGNPRWRWKDATSKKRRAATLTLFMIAIGSVLGLLIWAVREVNYTAATSTSDVFNLGFGAVDARALISSSSFPTSIASLALIANLPQLLLSFLYFAYNGLFTAMLGAYEWMSYAHKRKGLRISRMPSGAQRSTYFLQLPYRFGIPLIIISGTMHWLVSQSIFVVAFDVYDELGELQTAQIG